MRRFLRKGAVSCNFFYPGLHLLRQAQEAYILNDTEKTLELLKQALEKSNGDSIICRSVVDFANQIYAMEENSIKKLFSNKIDLAWYNLTRSRAADGKERQFFGMNFKIYGVQELLESYVITPNKKKYFSYRKGHTGASTQKEFASEAKPGAYVILTTTKEIEYLPCGLYQMIAILKSGEIFSISIFLNPSNNFQYMPSLFQPLSLLLFWRM